MNNTIVGVAGGISVDNCNVAGCSNLDPLHAEGLVGHPPGVGGQPLAYSIQMGSPAGGGASHFSNGTDGVWCQEARAYPKTSPVAESYNSSAPALLQFFDLMLWNMSTKLCRAGAATCSFGSVRGFWDRL